MRRELLLTSIFIAALLLTFFFMTQNTRFESNTVTCQHPKNTFKITFAKLDNGKVLSFEKNDQAMRQLSIRDLESSIFQFEDQTSNYKLDLTKLIATETLKGETLLYQCDHEKFKM